MLEILEQKNPPVLEPTYKVLDFDGFEDLLKDFDREEIETIDIQAQLQSRLYVSTMKFLGLETDLDKAVDSLLDISPLSIKSHKRRYRSTLKWQCKVQEIIKEMAELSVEIKNIEKHIQNL